MLSKEPCSLPLGWIAVSRFPGGSFTNLAIVESQIPVHSSPRFPFTDIAMMELGFHALLLRKKLSPSTSDEGVDFWLKRKNEYC